MSRSSEQLALLPYAHNTRHLGPRTCPLLLPCRDSVIISDHASLQIFAKKKVKRVQSHGQRIKRKWLKRDECFSKTNSVNYITNEPVEQTKGKTTTQEINMPQWPHVFHGKWKGWLEGTYKAETKAEKHMTETCEDKSGRQKQKQNKKKVARNAKEN